MKRFNHFFELARTFRRAEKGAAAVIFALMIIPVFALAGGVIDYGRAMSVKTELSATLDAAVLAATQAYAIDNSVDTQKIVSDFVAKNYSDAGKTLMSDGLTVDEPVIDADGQMTARVEAAVKTHFMRLVGVDQLKVVVQSSAIVGGRSLEIALVLDNTGSMSGSKITALKSSAKELVNTLMGDDTGDKVKIALVPFAATVNIGTSNRNEPGLDIPDNYVVAGSNYKWYGCMASRKYDLNILDENYGTGVPGEMSTYNNCNINEITRLTTNKGLVTAGLDKMKAEGATYIPGGLMWGWRLLSDQTPFADGVPYGTEEVQKAVVLMTDGANTILRKKTVNNSTKNHEGEVWLHSKYQESPAPAESNLFTAELCENIKAKGITIHTIAFQVPTGSSIETLMRNCAGNGGQFYDADDSSELAAAFRKISISLLNLRLSR